MLARNERQLSQAATKVLTQRCRRPAPLLHIVRGERPSWQPTLVSSITYQQSSFRSHSGFSRRTVSTAEQCVDSTIYALSTAPGRAAIAIVRVSGPACKIIYERICPNTAFPKPRQATFRALYDPNFHSRVLDSGTLVLFFPGPRSSTGEDVLEFHVHGGQAVVRAVLNAIPASISTVDSPHVVRYAEPGEFTRRAFMNDRLSLTQIEALGDTLSAVTEEQRRLSVQGTRNDLAERYERWRSLLLYARGELEALIDFSEDQHFDESPAELASNVAEQIKLLLQTIALHRANAVRGELLRNGISIALIGSPNVGKSSILNHVVGRNAAIVSKEAGTTRDIVEVGVDIGGFFCRLGDTAGLRTNEDGSLDLRNVVGEVEQEGIARAKARALSSDVVILVLAIDEGPDSQGNLIQLDPAVIETARQLIDAGKALVVAVNKMDRYGTQAQRMAAELPRIVKGLLPGVPEENVFGISCHAAVAVLSDGKPTGRNFAPDARRPSSLAQHADGPPLRDPSHQDGAVIDAQAGFTSSRNRHVAQISLSDPGNMQGLVTGLTRVFSQITAALRPDASDDVDASVWEESLGATERQRVLLEACETHLQNFLEQVNAGNHQSAEVDIVAAAECLRSAADCLGKITGRGEQGDVEEVLGVVFEKFCVGK